MCWCCGKRGSYFLLVAPNAPYCLLFITWFTKSLTQLNMETSLANWWTDLNSLFGTWLLWCSYKHTQNTANGQVFTVLIDEMLRIFWEYTPQSSICPHFTSAGICLLQDWLTESARLISKSGHTVEWVTPLGLPIIQPYHRSRSQVVSLESIHIRARRISKSVKSEVISSGFICVFGGWIVWTQCTTHEPLHCRLFHDFTHDEYFSYFSIWTSTAGIRINVNRGVRLICYFDA